MATYNVSRHRKQKMAALVVLEAELLRIIRAEVLLSKAQLGLFWLVGFSRLLNLI
jgi:hypothetical protein